MKRRNFIKAGILAIASIYFFPEKIFGVTEKSSITLDKQDTGYDGSIGLAFGKIINKRIFIPKEFIPFFSGQKIHLVAEKGENFLMLIPNKYFPEGIKEQDKVKLEFIKVDIPLTYIGKVKQEEDGNLFIDEKVLAFTGIHEGEVIFVGLEKFIEIWDKKVIKA